MVLLVRLPRVLLALLVGGGLAIGGAALQAIFRNPLVSPDIIGVSAGASFGGALALLLGLGSALLVGSAFAFGLAALGLLFLITSGRGGTPMLMIVLGGVVTGSFFSALVALITYLADPFTTLPAIVFWLLGSVATATYAQVLVAAAPVLAGTAVLLALRWRINVLSLGDDDAAALGLRPRPLRWAVLVSVALIVAGAVAVSGAVSWVGLVVPHLAQNVGGPGPPGAVAGVLPHGGRVHHCRGHHRPDRDRRGDPPGSPDSIDRRRRHSLCCCGANRDRIWDSA